MHTYVNRLVPLVKQHIFLLLFTLITFLLFLYPVSDADLGWHLRCGQFFWENKQIFQGNQFSFLLPDYQWINHSWLFDVIEYPLYELGGFTLLSLVGSILLLTSVWLVIPSSLRKQYSIFSLIPLVLFTTPLLNTGFKSMYISFLLTALVWKLLYEYTASKQDRYVFLLPLLFLLWANLHGQFMVGLGIVGLYALGHTIKIKHQTSVDKKLWLAIGLSILATLITPYGFKLYENTVLHLQSPLAQFIMEWQPWEYTSPLMILFYCYCAWLGWYMFKYRKTSLGEVLVLLALSVLAIKARRMIPFFILLSLPVFLASLEGLKKQYAHVWQLVIYAFIGILGFYVILQPNWRNSFHQSWDTYCASEIQCSEALIQFLKTQQIKGKIFNAYRLGSHLIYRYPEEKVFIDGRMTVWQDSRGWAPINDYTTIVYAGNGSRELFYDHNFDYVIINRQYPLATILQETERWPMIYYDDKIIVFQNPSKQ